MTLPPSQLRDLQLAIADRLYIQVEKWHLYLGDAGIAEALAIECSAQLNKGSCIAARQALGSVHV